MKTRGFTIVELVIAICILALIGSFGYVWYKGQTAHPAPSSDIAPSNSSPTPSPTEVLKFKTYTDSKYGYTIDIPEDWKIDTSYPPDGTQPHKYVSSTFSSPKSDTNFIVIADTYDDGTCGDDTPRDSIQTKIEGVNYTLPWLCANIFALKIKMPDGLPGYMYVANTPEALTALSTLHLAGIQITN